MKKNDVATKIEHLRKLKDIYAYERRSRVTRFVLKTLIQEGKFFRTSEGGFYFHAPSSQLFPLDHHSRGMSAFLEKVLRSYILVCMLSTKKTNV